MKVNFAKKIQVCKAKGENQISQLISLYIFDFIYPKKGRIEFNGSAIDIFYPCWEHVSLFQTRMSFGYITTAIFSMLTCITVQPS